MSLQKGTIFKLNIIIIIIIINISFIANVKLL